MLCLFLSFARMMNMSHSFHHNFKAVAKKCFHCCIFSIAFQSISFHLRLSHMTMMTLAFLKEKHLCFFFSANEHLYTHAHIACQFLLIDYHFCKKWKRMARARRKVDGIGQHSKSLAIIHSNSSNLSQSIVRQLKTCVNSNIERRWKKPSKCFIGKKFITFYTFLRS